MKKWKLFLVLLVFEAVFGKGNPAYGAQTGIEDLDFEEIQQFLEDSFGEESFDFKSFASGLAGGEIPWSAESFADAAWELLLGQIMKNREAVIKIMVLAVSAAVFSNIASVFQENQISQNAWFVIYLMLTGILLGSFWNCCGTVSKYLESLLTFIKLLIPAFCMALSCVCGAAAVSVWYQMTFVLVTMIDWLFLYLLLPGIRAYVCLYLLNELTGEDYLSGLLSLLQLLFEWILKTVSGVAISLQVVQGLILPAAGQLKGQFFAKLIQAVPGVGSGLRSASEILLGTGVLMKNGIGAAGCLVIAAICLIPILQLAVIVFLYYAASAVIQPVSDPRVTSCITGAAYGIRMLLKMTAIAAFLFAVSIALICAFTNRVF